MTEPTPPPGHEPDADEPTRAPEHGPSPVPIEPAPVDRYDEAASASLDGQPLVPADQIDDEHLAARIDELSAVTALLGAPLLPPEPSVVDSQIAAALAELPSSPALPTTASAGPAVVALESRRRRPAVGRWLAVAAAIAVVALAIPVVQSLSRSSSTSNDTATSAASTDSSALGEATSDGGPSSAVEPQSGSSTTATAPAFSQTTGDRNQSGGNIGSADDPVEMAALVHESAPDATDLSTTQTTVVGSDSGPPPTTAPAVTRTAPPACDDVARAHHPGLGSVRYTASATYQSIPVVVTVYEVPDPTTISYRLIVSCSDTCAVLLDLPYS